MTDTKYALDLSVCHFAQKHGDITAIGTWFGTESRRPCLVLVKTNAIISNERSAPCVIPLDNAWWWAEETGGIDIREQARTCMLFAEALGLNPHNKVSVMRVASIIRDHIGDLIRMPVAPTHDLKVVADLVYKDHVTGEEIHKEVKDRG